MVCVGNERKFVKVTTVVFYGNFSKIYVCVNLLIANV